MQCMFPLTLSLLPRLSNVRLLDLSFRPLHSLPSLYFSLLTPGNPLWGPQLPSKLHSLAPRLVWLQVTLLILAVQRRHLHVAHAPLHPLHVVWLDSFASQPCSVSAVGAATRHAAAEKAAALCLKLGGWGSALLPSAYNMLLETFFLVINSWEKNMWRPCNIQLCVIVQDQWKEWQVSNSWAGLSVLGISVLAIYARKSFYL